MELIFRIKIFHIMIGAVLSKNKLPERRKINIVRKDEVILFDCFVTKFGKQPWGEGGDFFWFFWFPSSGLGTLFLKPQLPEVCSQTGVWEQEERGRVVYEKDGSF
jgi:hypothetical protein